MAQIGRVALYFVALAVVSIYCELIGRVWCIALAPKDSQRRVRRANALVRHWNTVLTDLTLNLLSASLDVRGEVPPGRYIVLSNHQSTADIAMLSTALPSLNLKFVAKEELGRGIPAVSMTLRHFGNAIISKHGTRDDVKSLRAMATSLEHWDASVLVFPEGTRSRDGRLLRYRPGAVRLIADHADLPILPVAIDGTYVVADLVGFARRMRGARGVVTIGEPIPREQWAGRLDDVLQDVRAWTSQCLASGRAEIPARPETEPRTSIDPGTATTLPPSYG